MRQGGGDGCFIATAVYGSPLANEVMVLREYRDNVLHRSRHGRAFIWAYCQIGPPIAKLISNRSTTKALIRKYLLKPAIKSVQRKDKKESFK